MRASVTLVLQVAIVESKRADLDVLTSVIREFESYDGQFRFALTYFDSAEALLERVDEGYFPAICILAVCLPGLGGGELAVELRQRCLRTQFIFLSDSMNPEIDSFFKALGTGFSYYTKPIKCFDFLSGVNSAVSAWRALGLEEVTLTQRAIERILTESHGLTLNKPRVNLE